MQPFKHYVRVERASEVSDGQGGREITWETQVEDWARIERVRSFRGDVETVRAGGVASTPTVRIHMRSYGLTKGITASMRVLDVDEGTFFNIAFVQDIAGDGKVITMTATENLPA